MDIIRATIESFDETNHQADIRPEQHPASLWPAVPVAADISGETLPVGQAVAVLMWSDISGVILGPYGVQYAPFVHGTQYTLADSSLAIPTTWTDDDTLSVEIATKETCRLYLALSVSAHFDAVYGTAFFVGFSVNGALLTPRARVGQALANCYQNVSLVTADPTKRAPGVWTIKPTYYAYQTGTLTYRQRSLTVIAIPD